MGSKISDFGRAWAKDLRVAHDNFPIAGDPGYAPPELLYGTIPADENARRYGCDLYHLGSLATFFFTNVHMNALIVKHISPAHHPYTWGGSYAAVLPYVQDGFAKSLRELSAAIPPEWSQELTQLVSYLCQPDPDNRGHPMNGRRFVGQFGLERFISRFDYLACAAEVRLKSGIK